MTVRKIYIHKRENLFDQFCYRSLFVNDKSMNIFMDVVVLNRKIKEYDKNVEFSILKKYSMNLKLCETIDGATM